MAATTNIYGFNIGGNNNSFDQRGHFYRAFLSGNVSGMTVKQNSTPNMTVLVEHGSALLNKNSTSASIAEIKSDTSVSIDTANTANPRIDTVVIYEDTSVAIPTEEASYWQDGAGGRFKTVSLPGTAAASPVALSDANIQSAIGAGKPWTRLADITVLANSSTIINSNIADKRSELSSILAPKSVKAHNVDSASFPFSKLTFSSPAIGQVITGGNYSAVTFDSIKSTNGETLVNYGVKIVSPGTYECRLSLDMIDAVSNAWTTFFESSTDNGSTWSTTPGLRLGSSAGALSGIRDSFIFTDMPASAIIRARLRPDSTTRIGGTFAYLIVRKIN